MKKCTFIGVIYLFQWQYYTWDNIICKALFCAFNFTMCDIIDDSSSKPCMQDITVMMIETVTTLDHDLTASLQFSFVQEQN